ncbi:MAG TPA: MBL fold metallo-hydrolase [Dehalococcoidia bacterium]|nr:MBL fold metallo-hydrolase [Dehalococcoidia bacterium]
MDITWLGHSCFRLKGKEAVLITDPCSPDTGYNAAKQKADIVTISHAHIDHAYTDLIEGDYRSIDKPGEYEVKGVFITGMPSTGNMEGEGGPSKNTVFTIEMDGITFCHTGDIDHALSSREIEEIGNVGILLLPVGGISTIDSNTAAELVRSMSPGIVIPMHYKTPLEKGNLEPLDRFLKKMGIKEITSQQKLNINRATFAENTQIIVLDYPQ